MNENPKHEELTEEDFLELVLEEQEKALAQEREQRLNPTPQKKKKQKPIIRFIVWLITLSLIFNTFAIIFNMYSIPAIEFLRVSSHLSSQDTIQTYKKAVVTINTQDSKGTGFAISSDGYILTNEHVIDGALTISVTLPNGQIYEANILKSYEQFDLALLKIEVEDLSHLRLAKSSQFEAGEQVYFIGNPLYFSGIANEGTLLGYTNASSIDTDVVMMNAPVYKGNSGSPVINKVGEVIGIVFATGKRDPYGKVGLFIPIECVHENFSTFLP